MTKIFWIIAGSVVFKTPEIFESNLNDGGFFIGVPGMVIFSTKEGAKNYIEESHKIILEKGGKLYE